MRFIHTADWHLGRTLRGRSRVEELGAALDQLVDMAKAEEVDAVLIAGDIYDQRVLSADADKLVFETLLRMHSAGVRVVAVPGNHDSAPRLGAIAPVLDYIGCSVVPEGAETSDRRACRSAGPRRFALSHSLPASRSSPRAVSPTRLPSSPTSQPDTTNTTTAWALCSPHTRRASATTQLTSCSRHIFVSGSKPAGSERQITLGADYAISPMRLPATANYIALGHIHRPQKVSGSPAEARYSGSLIQLDFGERGQDKGVLLVEATPGKPPKTKTLPITAGRQLLDVETTVDELETLAKEVGDAYLRVNLKTETPVPGLADRVRGRAPKRTGRQARSSRTRGRGRKENVEGARPARSVRRLLQGRACGRARRRVARSVRPRLRRGERLVRPLHLKIKGFTAFRDEQELDFRELDLFSLWGPTGSGKSSVLDAITFALYGKVERVEGTKEEKLSALITHGQPRMAVTLDFETGGTAYRITRTNSVTGSKVRLERKEGEDFVTHGEGADSVTEVNKEIPRLIGLDYNAFTRSVVLPQGKFAEFLAGDAKKRRDILTELLGLEMFGRMAGRANEISSDAKSRLEAKSALLASEYEGIDKKTAAEAAATATRLEKDAKAATEAETLLEELAQESDEQTRKAQSLVELGEEVDDIIETFEEHAEALEGHGRQLDEASEVARVAREEMKAREKEHAALAKERGRLEEEYGTLEDLADLRAQVMTFQTLQRDAEKAAKTAAEQALAETAAKKALKEHDAVVKKAEATLEKAHVTTEKRKQEHDAAHRHDQVGALTQDLHAGDPCPVCERPLESIPDTDVDFTAAKKALADAEIAEERAQSTLASARNEQVRASQVVSNAQQRVQECVAEEKEKLRLLEDAREQLASLFAGEKKDPLKEIESRQKALREVVGAKEEAVKKLTVATSADRVAQEALSTIKTEAAAIKGAIEGAPLGSLSERATEALGRTVKVKLPSKLPAGATELAARCQRGRRATRRAPVVHRGRSSVGARADSGSRR